jgi:DMSO/TMAO reductase YedYZ molybdopterin-dependent catalytic subunit
MTFVSRGFRGRGRHDVEASRLPPGQYATSDFPVLSAGPTPAVRLDDWRLSINGVGGKPRTWTWDEFRALPTEEIKVDIHCVTKWSKFDTTWTGVSVDTLLEGIRGDAKFVLAHSHGDYSSNLPIDDVTGGKAWIAFEFDGRPLEPEHGGPARLLVPHLYFWKSAKWISGLELRDTDRAGFWETYGYHNYGDPWREQRYAGD